MAKRYFTLIVVVTVIALVLIGGLRFLGQNKDGQTNNQELTSATTTSPAPLPDLIGSKGLFTSYLVMPLTSAKELGWASQNYNHYRLNPNTVYTWVVKNKIEAKVTYYDITDWSTKNTYDQNGAVRFSSAWKRSCLTGLANFTKNSSSTCEALPSDSLYDEVYSLLHHSNINSDFGRGDVMGIVQTKSNLRGLYYITFSPQEPSYEPVLLVYLTGQVDGREVLMSGEFKLYDQRFKEVNASFKKIGMVKTNQLVLQYRNDVRVKHQILPDLQALINESLAYFDTFQIVTEKVNEYTR